MQQIWYAQRDSNPLHRLRKPVLYPVKPVSYTHLDVYKRQVVIGFTNGIAVVIFLAQIKDFFGLQIDNLPAEFFSRITSLAANAHTVDLPTLALACLCFIFLLSYNRLAQRFPPLRRAPGPLVVLIAGTLISFIFNLPVETIGSRFHGIPQELSLIHI